MRTSTRRKSCLEFFLLLHAEALLFIDHDEAKVLELDVFRKDPVGADDDIDGAISNAGHGGALGLGGLETTETIDPHGIGGVTFAQIFPVLLGEDRGGDEKRGLFALLHGLEDCADRDFRFAEADIAADEPVHRAGAFHIALGFEDGPLLVLGFLVDECVLEFLLPCGIGRIRVAGQGIALGLHAKKLRGVIHDRFLRGNFCAFPARTAEGIERRVALADADILGDEIRLLDRDVEFALLGELEDEDLRAVGFSLRGGQGGDSLVEARCHGGDGRRNRRRQSR